jgi:hypothetical protein
MALAVPASAHAAPPPARESQTTDDCVKALNVLSFFKLLPTRPNLSRTLCSMNEAEQTQVEQTSVEQTQAGQTQAGQTRAEDPNSSYTSEIEIEYTDKSGKTVQTEKALGTIVEWPAGLTVTMPVFSEVTYSYVYRSGNR